MDKVIKNGAIANTVEVIIDLAPNSYVSGESAKITCKAIGKLDLEKLTESQIIEKESSKILEIMINNDNVENYVYDTKKFEE